MWLVFSYNFDSHSLSVKPPSSFIVLGALLAVAVLIGVVVGYIAGRGEE